MNQLVRQPAVSVGLLTGAGTVTFHLQGEYLTPEGDRFAAGEYRAALDGDVIALGERRLEKLDLRPARPDCSFIIRDILIGIDFHWERRENQEFHGALRIEPFAGGGLAVINELAVEEYLLSVISSEMSAASHPELLKAHAIISRSWLLAQMPAWKRPRNKPAFDLRQTAQGKELIRWYDQESHAGFDVCADDHCQRYQGITKAASGTVPSIIRETFGLILAHQGELCDARFSKSCGGITERFAAAWEDVDLPYLQSVYDGEHFPAGFALPLTDEANAAAWIRQAPPAWCNTHDQRVLSRILPDFDQETTDFYRWQATLSQEELQELLLRKLGLDLGPILRLEPVARAASGRIVRLRIVGERDALLLGKELEIRRALSPSHLYSSAFLVEFGETRAGIPAAFTLRGAGWGHGVGLCQIGAALMAEGGNDFRRILRHYYRGAEILPLYSTGT
ncbi:MAG: SpoIID/LytB domain-containing protein [Blastocatellia bacterium]|nr:SpoIID/LytB domain-containing protein [Blastocatellia bacterium]